MSILPSASIQGLFPAKITSLDDLPVYQENKEVTGYGSLVEVPAPGFMFTPSPVVESGGAPLSSPTVAKRPMVPQLIKGAVTTARGFSGMVSSSGGVVVKSTLVQEENTGGPRVQIDHVVVMGTGPDDACNAFEANPFKPESAYGGVGSDLGWAPWHPIFFFLLHSLLCYIPHFLPPFLPPCTLFNSSLFLTKQCASDAGK